MSIQHNSDLVEQIYADNAIAALTTIQDFLRWTLSCFNRSDIYFGQGYDNPWDEALQLVLGGLQLPLDFPAQFYTSKLTTQEKETLLQMLITRLAQRVPVAYLTQSAWFCGLVV